MYCDVIGIILFVWCELDFNWKFLWSYYDSYVKKNYIYILSIGFFCYIFVFVSIELMLD